MDKSEDNSIEKNQPLLGENDDFFPELAVAKKKKSFKDMSREEIEGYGDINQISQNLNQ